MRSIPIRVVSSPRLLPPDRPPPPETRDVTLAELCDAAGIECRVTIDSPPRIALHAGREHLRSRGVCYVAVGRSAMRGMTRVRAIRILEVLAYGFHDYGARESVCGRGIFVVGQTAAV